MSGNSNEIINKMKNKDSNPKGIWKIIHLMLVNYIEVISIHRLKCLLIPIKQAACLMT